MAPAEKVAQVRRLTDTARRFAPGRHQAPPPRGLRARAAPAPRFLLARSRDDGPPPRLGPGCRGDRMSDDPLPAALRVAGVLEELGVPYVLGARSPARSTASRARSTTSTSLSTCPGTRSPASSSDSGRTTSSTSPRSARPSRIVLRSSWSTRATTTASTCSSSPRPPSTGRRLERRVRVTVDVKGGGGPLGHECGGHRAARARPVPQGRRGLGPAVARRLERVEDEPDARSRSPRALGIGARRSRPAHSSSGAAGA